MLGSVIARGIASFWSLLLLLGLTGLAPAQADPAATADAAVTDWLEQSVPPFQELAALEPAELCRYIPALLVNPAPPAGTRVNLDDRLELPAEAADQRVFSYSAAGPSGQLAVVQVVLEQDGPDWRVRQVGFRQPAASGLRAWVQTSQAAWVFSLLSIALLVMLVVPGPLRRLLLRSLNVIRQHRRTYVFTLVLLGSAFAAGTLTGRQLPEECTAAIMETVEAAVDSVGATEAYASGSIPRAAAVTFHQNFIVVSASTLTGLALLFGVPAYLFGGLSFYLQAVPFGLINPGGSELVLLLILLLLELVAYFSVIAGGGFLLVTLVKKGMRALPEAVGKLLLMLPVAAVLLIAGAWYEAWLLIGLP